MPSFLITISYDGGNFIGWEKQTNGLTIQGTIEKILSKVFFKEISIVASSRTDKGVHALNQKFLLKLDFEISLFKVRKVLKKVLEPTFLIKSVVKVSNSFNIFRSVIQKEYRYKINTGKFDIFSSRYSMQYGKSINVSKINKILEKFVGYHNFVNFCFIKSADKTKTNYFRKIKLARAFSKNNLLVIRFISSGFLRYQIRIMVSETISCYEEKQSINDIANKLEFPDKFPKYKSISTPNGLYLWKIDTIY